MHTIPSTLITRHTPSITSLPRNTALNVGLLGGSFDPPHEGHLLITKQAIKFFNFHYVIWLVTPQNPFKNHAPATLQQRMLECNQKTAGNPKILVSDIEKHIKTVQTCDTLIHLHYMYPRINFVWLMGADNLYSFHKWHRWEQITGTTPIVIFPRGTSSTEAGLSKFASRFSAYRANANDRIFFKQPAPCWTLFNRGPTIDISSTYIRSNTADNNKSRINT